MVSNLERQRRYEFIRKDMKAQGYAALVISGNTESIQHGYIRYLSDWRLWGGTGYIVLPLEGNPVLILGKGSQYYWAKQLDWIQDVRSGFNKIDEVIKVLKELGLTNQKIGVIGLTTVMTNGDARHLFDSLKEAAVEDATALLDQRMEIKSNEEITQMAETYNLVAEAVERVKQVLSPGKTERECMAEAIGYLGSKGCFEGLAHIGHHASPSIRPATDRILGKEDILKVFLQWAGPSGHWIELSAIYSFQTPPERYKNFYDTLLQATEHMISLMKPGAIAGEISQAASDICEQAGYRISDRVVWDFHGIGMNVDTAPYGLPDSTEILRENMVLNIHPGLVMEEDHWGASITENVVVTPQSGKVLGICNHQWQVLA
jgi:Xaa-Pro aminopeptidase